MEMCKQPPGTFKPVVNFGLCEGKALCLDACPYDVFTIEKIRFADYQKLGFLSRMKNRVHGGKVAYTPNGDQCRACGLCVKACPEDAIKLVKVTSDSVELPRARQRAV